MTSDSGEKFQFLELSSVTDLSAYGIYLLSLINLFSEAFANTVDVSLTLDSITGDSVSYVIDKTTDKVVGFISILYTSEKKALGTGTPKKGYYLQAAAVAKEVWGNGLFKKMMEKRIDEAIALGVKIVFLETQNPKIEKAILSTLEKKKKEAKIKGFYLRRKKQKKYYEKMLSESEPVLDKSDTGKAFSRLNFKVGDAYILTFRLRY